MRDVAAAIERYLELLERMMRVLARAEGDGCDLRRTGLWKIYVHPKVGYDVQRGLEAIEERDGRRYPSDFTLAWPHLGRVAGFDLVVDNKMLDENGIVLRYEVPA